MCANFASQLSINVSVFRSSNPVDYRIITAIIGLTEIGGNHSIAKLKRVCELVFTHAQSVFFVNKFIPQLNNFHYRRVDHQRLNN